MSRLETWMQHTSWSWSPAVTKFHSGVPELAPLVVPFPLWMGSEPTFWYLWHSSSSSTLLRLCVTPDWNSKNSEVTQMWNWPQLMCCALVAVQVPEVRRGRVKVSEQRDSSDSDQDSRQWGENKLWVLGTRGICPNQAGGCQIQWGECQRWQEFI